MHSLCRPESFRDYLRRRKQNPSSAMHSLRGCQRSRDRSQSSTTLQSKTKASPNPHLQKRSVGETPPHDG
jgi:hypothetical protein